VLQIEWKRARRALQFSDASDPHEPHISDR
jgi:hypothetical protein